MTERRIEHGRTPTKTTVTKHVHLPVLGVCEDRYKTGERCNCKAYYRNPASGILQCGRHYLPQQRLAEGVERDSDAYREHHVINYQADMMKLPWTEVEGIAQRHRVGTIPQTATVYERLRLEARGEAAERELVRRKASD